MREFHPVTDPRNPAVSESRIILGSFPTHRFTRKSEDKSLSDSKGYFYGGERNLFWHWYAQFVDHTARKESLETLRSSLEQKEIGITDIIYACDRTGVSASDNDLKNRIYNHGFLQLPAAGKKLKILCTSKGVMNNMLLTPALFERFPELKTNEELSRELEERVLENLDSFIPQIPLARVLTAPGNAQIEIVSLPSPGSPFRSLKNFGYKKGGDAKLFLNGYLQNTFNWFLEQP